MKRATSRNQNAKHSQTATITTRAGRLASLGTARWGQQLVVCPNCGGRASVDAAGDVWCWVCNYTSAAASGCT